MTKETFQAGMAILQAAYPGFIAERTGIVTMDVYWKFLNHIPNESFEMGVRKHVRERKNFPTIADLLEACELDYQEAAALDAWSEVMLQISSVGSWGSPKFSHPQTSKVVESIGGWRMLCATETSRIGRHRDAFLKTFKALYVRQKDFDLLVSDQREKLRLGEKPGLLEK